jgi:hypothetical protein
LQPYENNQLPHGGIRERSRPVRHGAQTNLGFNGVRTYLHALRIAEDKR